MTEEERKAVEILNTFEFRGKTRNYKEISLEDSKSIKIVLNLLGKLQKENEELKIKNNAIKRESEAYAEYMIRLDNELNLEKEKSKYEWIRRNCLSQELVNKLYIPIQKIKDRISERQFELQQEYKDFEDDAILIVLQELIEEREENNGKNIQQYFENKAKEILNK